MKTCDCLTVRRGLFFVLFCAELWTGTVSRAAVALTLNPSTISNTYSGSISLQITGLMNGETVLLERFIDANANAIIDSGELLVQSFDVTDGRLTVFGGVRDTNIAGDENGITNGLINTLVYFSASPEFGRGVGSYVFRVSSPTARFNPVTQPFTVTQTTYSQRITGTVTSSGSPVTNAAVALLIPVGQDIQFIAATLADGAGNYSLNAAPSGTSGYLVLAAKPGYVSDLSVAPMITLSPGQVLTQNLTLTAPTRTISGTVSDVASSNGIPGLQLFIQSDNSALTFAFTDTNGNFTASVVSDQWKIDISDFSLSQTGYLRPQNKPRIDTTTGNVTGVSIQLARETALIYGYLKNDTNAPLPGISFSCNDNSNQYQANATTDTNGFYLVGVTAGTWYIGPDNNNPALAGYLVQGTNVNVTGGEAISVNFTALRATAHLLGRVTDTNGLPVSDLTILAFSQNGASSSATTAPDGSFDLGVFGGSWTAQLETSGAAQRNLIGPTLTYNVTDGVNITNINYVVRNVTAQINGFVRNSQAAGLANVFVHASATNDGTYYSQSVQTDAGGNYQLGVINGTWQIGVNCFDLNNLGYGCPTEQTVVVNGANQTANFTVPPSAELSFLFRHFAEGGDFGSGLTPAPVFPVTINGYNAGVQAKNDTVYPPPDNVFFTGPAGSGLTGSPAAVSAVGGGNSMFYFSSKITSPPFGPGGTWTVNYKGNPYNFINVSDPQAASHLTLPLPTVSVTNDLLKTVAWIYKDSAGNALPGAPAFVTGVQVQLFDRDLNLIDASSFVSPSFNTYSPVSTFQWSNIGRIRMQYIDTLTNRFFVVFTKEAAALNSPARFSNNQFQFLLKGATGQDYIVQYSTTLTNWVTLFTTNAPNNSFLIADPSATNAHRFYRIRTP